MDSARTHSIVDTTYLSLIVYHKRIYCLTPNNKFLIHFFHWVIWPLDTVVKCSCSAWCILHPVDTVCGGKIIVFHKKWWNKSIPKNDIKVKVTVNTLLSTPFLWFMSLNLYFLTSENYYPGHQYLQKCVSQLIACYLSFTLSISLVVKFLRSFRFLSDCVKIAI